MAWHGEKPTPLLPQGGGERSPPRWAAAHRRRGWRGRMGGRWRGTPPLRCPRPPATGGGRLRRGVGCLRPSPAQPTQPQPPLGWDPPRAVYVVGRGAVRGGGAGGALRPMAGAPTRPMGAGQSLVDKKPRVQFVLNLGFLQMVCFRGRPKPHAKGRVFMRCFPAAQRQKSCWEYTCQDLPGFLKG